MSTLVELVDQALSILQEIRAELVPPAPPPSTEVIVGPGANLVSVLASLTGGETVRVDPTVTSTDLVITKPVTLIGGQLLGNTQVKASNVTFLQTKFKGTTNGQTILVAGEGTTVNDCDLVGSDIGQHRGILANAKNITIKNTRISNIWHSIDTQAILGYEGTENLLVEDCYLEASGENIMFGGADPSSESLIPKNIVIRNCHMYKPMEWLTKANCGVKNLFELKNVKNILVENCVFENCFVDAQIGFAIVMSVRNQDGRAPFSTIEDVIFRNNTVKHMAGAISVLGKDYLATSQMMKRVLIEGNKFEDINPALFGVNGRQIQISHGGQDVVFRNNTFDGVGLNSLFSFTGGLGDPLTGMVVEGNRFQEGSYGIVGDGAPSIGKAAFDYYNPSGYTWTNNTIVKGTSGRNITYPVGTTLS